jgi:hypothetical protein
MRCKGHCTKPTEYRLHIGRESSYPEPTIVCTLFLLSRD